MARIARAITALGALLPLAAQAAPRLLDPMFTDHAVVQRGQPIAIWGEAAPGAQVDVAFGPAHAKAKAGADGVWRATLPPMKAGGRFTLTASAGLERLDVKDIAVGDVFLCSGQSNMEWPVGASVNGKDEVARSADEVGECAREIVVAEAPRRHHECRGVRWIRHISQIDHPSTAL